MDRKTKQNLAKLIESRKNRPSSPKEESSEPVPTPAKVYRFLQCFYDTDTGSERYRLGVENLFPKKIYETVEARPKA